MKDPGVQRVGDVLKAYMRERGWLSGNPYAPLFEQWNRIAGDPLSGHCTIEDVVDGVLIVQVEHPGWMQMAQMRSKKILADARKAAPDARLESMRVRLGPGVAGGIELHFCGILRCLHDPTRSQSGQPLTRGR